MRLGSLSSILVALFVAIPQVTLAQSESDPETDLFGPRETIDELEKPPRPAKPKKRLKKEKTPDSESTDPFAPTVEDAPKSNLSKSDLSKSEGLDPLAPPDSSDGLGKTEGPEKMDGIEKTDGLEKAEPQEGLDAAKRQGKKGKKGKKTKKTGEVTDAEITATADTSTGLKALEGTTAYLGLGKVRLSGDLGQIVSGAYEYSLEATRYKAIKNAFGIGYGVSYRYDKAEKSAVSPALTSLTSKVKHEQHNADVHVGVNYTVVGGFGLGVDLAGVMQLDSLLITTPSSSPFGDDYYVSYGIGVLSRLEMHYKFAKAIVRLNYSAETGRKQQSQTLYFNNRQIDINPTQTIIGLQVGFFL